MTQPVTAPTPFDRPIDEARAALRASGEAPEGITAFAAMQRRQEAEGRLQQLIGMREQFAASQAELTNRIGAQDYDRWRQHGWFMPPQIDTAIHTAAAPLAARREPVLVIQHKDMAGQITVLPREVSYEGTAAQDAKAIEAGVLHAKDKWQKGMAIDGGDAEFRATAWAYAKIHGVKVVGYKPKLLSAEWKLARTIISRENAARKAATRLQRAGHEVGTDGIPVLRDVVQPARTAGTPAAAAPVATAPQRQHAFA